MDIPSLKKHIIQDYSLIPLYDGMQDHKLILITAAGTIVGTPILKDDDDESALSLAKMTAHYTSDYGEKYSLGDDFKALGNDGFLMIKNVEIINLNQKTHLPFLIVFFDQIIGVSIGDITRNS